MSKDLLAELDTFYQPSSTATNPNQKTENISFFDDVGFSSAGQQPQTISQDDDWGDFEDAAKAPLPRADSSAHVQSTHVKPADLLLDDLEIDRNEAKTPSRTSGAKMSAGEGQAQLTKPTRPKLDDNVLFDAEYEIDNGDDFGDFENGNATPEDAISAATGVKASRAEQPSSQSLVDLDFGDTESQNQQSNPWQAESKVSSFRISTPAEPDRFQTQKRPAIQTTPAAVEQQGLPKGNDDSWGDFDDWLTQPDPANTTAPAKRLPANQSKMPNRSKPLIDNGKLRATAQQQMNSVPTEEDNWDDFEDKPSEQPSNVVQNPILSTFTLILPDPSNPSTLPPTNVPPPSLVFTLFAPLVEEAQKTFFQPLSALVPASKTEALNHITAQNFLRDYIAVGTVAGRTIAGRKLRWKRDTRLSQSMRIGASGGKGMKLAGVDKSELAKEDREVAELVRVWNAQVGKLRAVVAPTNHLISKASGLALGTVPDLKTVMPVVTVKEAEGAVPSQRACALCGLKREERLAGIEKSEVGDMFGEWWIEGTSMHRSCRNFWEARSGDLRTR